MGDLATRSDVLRIAYGRTTGTDISGSIVDDAISDAQEEIYSQYNFTNKVKFLIWTSRTQYEFRKGRNQTFAVDRLFINSPNISVDNAINRNEIASGSYTTDLNKNTITISSGLVASWNGSYGEVDFIPYEWHLLTKNKAALNLLDADMAQMNAGDQESENPRVSRIAKRIKRLEMSIRPMEAVGSFENRVFDERDRPVIDQRRFNKTA